MKQRESDELEVTVIRSMLQFSEVFMDAVSLNALEDIFQVPEHRTIYREAMDYFYDTGRAPTMECLFEKLILSGKYPGLRNFFLEELALPGVSINAVNMLKLLTERKIESVIMNYIKSRELKGLDFAVGLQEHIMQTMTKYIDGCIREIRNAETGDEVMQEIRKTMEGVSDEYIRTGITSLDRQVIGIPKRHLTVIAGRPGMGKTAFMLQIARNIMDQGYKVGIFSLEMEVQSLWVRNLSEATDIDSLRIEDGKLNAEEYVRLKAASEKYRRDNYIIDDSPSQTPEQIKARINLWKTRGKADVIMIDYLTLINTNYNKERYDLEIGSLARDLRIFAKKTCTPIIILSQLNREPERRQNRKPQLSDLRESGTIEQEAKLVLLLHRPWVYGIDPYEGSRFSHYTKGGERLKPEEYMEVIIAKARNGRIGFAPVRYIPEVHRIEAVTTREHGNGAF